MACLVQSVDRSLDILRLVAGARGSMPLAELAAAMGVKPTTLHNLAATLVARGYLIKTTKPTGYTLGPALAELIELHARRRFDRDVAASLRALAQGFPDATITLAQCLGGEVLVALRLSPQRPGVIERPTHRAMSPYASASGLALQAFASTEECQTCRRLHPFDEYGAGMWADRAALRRFLDHARRQGHVRLPRGQWLRLAVPLWSDRGDLRAILGLSVELNADQTADAVADQALEAIEALPLMNEHAATSAAGI